MDNSANETQLASALSPILAATASMNAEDAAAVQVAVSVAQDSFELWIDGTEYGPYQTSAFSEYDQCWLGNLENQSFQTEQGATATCINSEWYLSSTRLRSARPTIQFAAYRPAASAPVRGCGDTVGQGMRYIIDGDVEGAVAGFFGGLLGGGIPGATAGAIGAGAGVSVYRAGKKAGEAYLCFWGLLT